MEKPSRRVRLKLACARCQRRKIKCDGAFPECGHCQAAGIECADGDSARLGPVADLHRGQTGKLQQRVRHLEAIIRARCPDIDLSGDALASLGDACESATPAAQDSIRPESVSRAPPVTNNGLLAHEIGLVSLGGSQDTRYIGPSSGYFLARLLLSSGRRDGSLNTRRDEPLLAPPPLPQGLVECLQGPIPLPPLDRAKQVCAAFFDIIHPQYPILYEPALTAKLEQGSRGETLSKADSFHVFMVLAIGAVLLSQRHRISLPSESYCLSALQHLEAINVENSVSGLQCLLLLLIFTMHCPNVKVNLWYLNYQCIASVLDLGLQRDVRSGNPDISVLDQELRTRLFWVVLTLDRNIATMMGRPIGLRDEACDLRLPHDIQDGGLSTVVSIHLFKLTKLKSEFKYVANSIVRDTPRYAYPAIVNIQDWQRDFLHRLEAWEAAVPATEHGAPYLHRICRLRCLELKMVSLRPCPAIPTPTTASVRECYETARQALDIFSQLYRSSLLIHSWDTFYSVTLTTITLLYCVRAVPGLTTAQALGDGLEAGLRVLGAVGEYWIGAKRCRDILEELGRVSVAWLRELPSGCCSTRASQRPEPMDGASQDNDLGGGIVGGLDMCSDMPNISGGFFDGLEFDGTFGDTFGLGDSLDDMDTIMRGLFDDLIPT